MLWQTITIQALKIGTKNKVGHKFWHCQLSGKCGDQHYYCMKMSGPPLQKTAKQRAPSSCKRCFESLIVVQLPTPEEAKQNADVQNYRNSYAVQYMCITCSLFIYVTYKMIDDTLMMHYAAIHILSKKKHQAHL